jgi:hypothetical protein
MHASINSRHKTWPHRPITQALAVVIVYAPLYAFAFLTSISGRTVTLRELGVYRCFWEAGASFSFCGSLGSPAGSV